MFILCQTFKEQKPRGGKQTFIQNGVFFDKEDYQRVKAQAEVVAGDPEAERPIGCSVFTQYKPMFCGLCKVQTARRVIAAHWGGIWKEAFDKLEKHCKERTPRKKKETCWEKATSEFSPHSVAEHHHKIEEALWISGYDRVHRSTNTALRDCFCCLHLTSESLCRAKLSDFLSLAMPKKDKDVHPMFLMIHSIPIGKTAHGSAQCGQAMRHNDVNLCAVGSMSMYLNYVFCNSREFHEFTLPVWLARKRWFDVKLLTDLIRGNKTVMSNDSYTDKL